MAVFVYHIQVFCPLVFCAIVSARPVSIVPQSDSRLAYNINSSTSTPETLITACLVSFIVLLALLAVKLVYMKHRRLSAIRSRILQSTSLHDVSLNSRSSLLSLKAIQLNASRSKWTPSLAILVGCLGSPAWEIDIESDFDANSTNQRRTASFMYQLHRQSKQCTYSAAYRSSKSSTSQAPPSQAQLSRSMSFFSFSSEHSTEGATKKLRSHPPVPNTRVLPYPTKARSRKTATIAPQRYSLPIDSSMSGPLDDFCENYDASRSILRAHSVYYPSGQTTSGVDLGPSLRLVGTSNVTAVPYSFLSAFPPSSYVLSPLTGTRDSLQLSRCHSTKSTRKSLPPLPSLPSYSFFSKRSLNISPAELPASLPPTACIPRFLPLLEFSPPASMGSFSAFTDQAPAHLSDNALLSPSNFSKLKTTPLISPSTADSVATVKNSLPHVLHPADPLVFAVQKMKRKTKHKRSSTIRSRSGIAPSASPLRIMALPEDISDRKPIGDTPISEKENHDTAISARKAFDGDRIHCLITDTANWLSPILDPTSSPDAQLELRHLSQPTRSVKSSKSLACSDIEGSLSEVSSLQTPKSDRLDEVDIGMLGLDRFHWAEESEEMLKSCSSHIKNDSVALISFWEEGQWMRENNQW